MCYVARFMRLAYSWFPVVALSLVGCALGPDDEMDGDEEQEIASSGAWYLLSNTHDLGAATVTVANGYKVTCPNGTFAKSCAVASLVVPATCNFECQDGLFGGQGETLVRGKFSGTTFVIAAGLDTWRTGLGTNSLYQLRAAATCAHDPCPSSLTAQKLNTTRAATAVTSVDFHLANDTNYVIDPTRGDDQASSAEGLLATGKIVNHVFRADRVWRLETSHPACEPQLFARDYVFAQGGASQQQFRTVAEAERFVVPEDPADPDADRSSRWLVRTAETPAKVEFTSGINDLWAQKFEIDKATCALTVTAEH